MTNTNMKKMFKTVTMKLQVCIYTFCISWRSSVVMTSVYGQRSLSALHPIYG